MRSSLRRLGIRVRLRLALARAAEDESVRCAQPKRMHVFVALAADYGNVGDLAITQAQTEFLQKHFLDAVVEQIPISRTLGAIKRLRRVIGPEDIVTLIGGGNTGDMYDDIQYLRELFIRNFPHNQIISFPQTIEFSDTPYGRWASRRASQVYNAHPRLAVMARDSRSYERAMRLFPACEVVLAPDVVLTVDATSGAQDRSGVLLALRADLERGLDDDGQAAILKAVGEIGSVRHRDTHVGDVRLDQAEADALLDGYWRDWRSAAVVVTDRLHGMIFAVITGTPCLALDSGTGKVSMFYGDWLQGHPSVALVQKVDQAALAAVMDADGSTGRAVRVDRSHLLAERFDRCRAALDVH